MRFYLGTHMPNWLERTDVPLFVSHRRLRGRRSEMLPLGRWGLDSGGFTELSTYGEWRISEAEYVDAVHRYASWGGLDWAAPQDWMTEPFVTAMTGLSIEEHQRRTVDSVLSLRSKAPELPFIPVLQGQSIADYLACVQMYEDADVDLWAERVVGLGSVCRRQNTQEIEDIVSELAGLGLALHGFGVKVNGLRRYGPLLASSDSMAWSFDARRRKGGALPGCAHLNCANCIHYALAWRTRLLAEAT